MLDAVAWEVLPPQEESDLPYATHAGVLHIGEYSLKCYRLSDGRAIFDADDFLRFWGEEPGL